MIHLATTDEDLARCYPVMKQLRPHLTEARFIEQARRQGREHGYAVCFLEEGGDVRCVAGFRISESLADGKFLYVDDLVADEVHRSRGHGERVFDWLVAHARASGCVELGLESGVQRFAAHRFYFARRMRISSYHFSLSLK